MHIPGTRAGVYLARQCFNSCLRVVLNSRCRLSKFALSSLGLVPSLSAQGEVTDEQPSGFPLPLPYPEALRKRWRAEAKEVSRKKMINTVVIALNYTTLGRASSCPPSLFPGRPLTSTQWGIVRHLEAFLEEWLEAGEVGPESMGRAAPKIESIEMALQVLRVYFLATGLKNDYFGPGKEGLMQGGFSSDVGEVVGQGIGTSFSTFKELVPSRLRFVGTPNFDPLPYLDPAGASVYAHPLKCRVQPEVFEGRVPVVKMHCSFDSKIKLFELLDSCKRLKLATRHEVDPRFASGMFAVVKSLEQDRLIMDSRPANALEVPLEGWIKSLGSAEALTKLYIPEGYDIVGSGSDLRDFYHLFKVSDERARRNVLCGSLPTHLLRHLNCFEPAMSSEPFLYGCLATLAMGDTQAVTLAPLLGPPVRISCTQQLDHVGGAYSERA